VARDYYEVLGVARDASADEIQRTFRTLARRYHPDVNRDPGAEERFKQINEAYQVLADPATRSRYDRFGPDFRRIPEDVDVDAGPGRGQGSPFGGAGGARRVRREDVDVEDLFGGVGGFEDFFGGSWRAGGPIPGADQEAELPLTVEDAFTGGKRQVTLAGPDGQRRYDVTIPPGVIDGQRIRLSGQGGQGMGNGPAGDLYLRVRIQPDSRYRLDGRDIHVDLPVAPWEAALGATVAVLAPGGELKVVVPGGSSSGRKLRVAGEGMPNRRGKPGDLYAEVRIVVPQKLKRRERELFEELARESTFDPRSAR
jgi:curved DNA-binding protein